MSGKSVLITGVGGDIGQSIIKCLKETARRLSLTGCDTDIFAAGRSMVKKFYKSPPAVESERYLGFVKRIVRENDINYIFPSTEKEILFFDAHRDDFSDGVTVFINRPGIVKTFFDKYDTVNFLKENGLPYPETHLLEECAGRISFPAILKPRKGWGGKELTVVTKNAELDFYKERLKGFIVQEIVGRPDEEYTATVFCAGKACHSIAFKRRLGYGSLTKVAILVNDKKIDSLMKDIARASSLEGSLNVQCRKTDKGYVPFEINPRFSSTVYLRHHFGFKDVKWWIDHAEGIEPEYKPEYKAGIAVRTIGETFYDMEAC